MRKFILSILILLSLTSTVYSAQLNGNQLREDYATKTYVNGTIENNVYTKTQTNATIEAAIAAATAEISTNKTVTVTAGENLTAGDVVSLINNYGTVTAKKNNLTVNTSPNGSESVFNSAASSYISACTIDDTRFIVINGKDGGDSNYPKATVGTVSGSTISWGSESAALENYAGGWTSVCKIGTDKILAIYSANGKGKAVVLSISGSTITVNTPYEYLASQPEYNSVTTLENDKALLTCRKADVSPYAGIAFILSVSGTTISGAATEVTFNAAATSYISVSALSSTSAIVAYKDGADNYEKAQVLTISGTSITTNTEYTVSTANSTSYVVCAANSATSAIISFDNNTTTGKVLKALISGTAISFSATSDLGIYQYVSIANIDSTRSLIFGNSGGNVGYTYLLVDNGTTITVGTGCVANNAATSGTSVCFLTGAQKLALAFTDGGNNSYGTSVINTWANTSYDSIAGVSQSTYTSGQTASILLNGTQSGYSNLIQGATYFVGLDYGISTVPVSLNGSTVKIGEAINSSTLFVH